MGKWMITYNSDDLIHYGTKGHSGIYARTPKINSATDYTNPLSKSKTPSTKNMVQSAKKIAQKQIEKRIHDMYYGSKEIPNNIKITGVKITGIDKKTGTFAYTVHYSYGVNGGKVKQTVKDFVKGKAKF